MSMGRQIEWPHKNGWTELLAGKKIEMPPIRQVSATFKKAPDRAAEQQQEF